jgi:polyisoprenoid-binding protein YceI
MKYASRVSFLVLAACLVAPAVSYADATTFQVGADGKSRATFVSDAPLETMKGTSKKVSGTLSVDPSDITQTSGELKCSVKSMKTGNDLRDEHLQGDGWLDAKKNPFVHFAIKEVVLGKKGNKELKEGKDVKVEVKGDFTAHGITKPVTAKGTVKWSGNTIRVKASFPVVLTDHNISVPSIVRLKVANEIQVSVDLLGTAN